MPANKDFKDLFVLFNQENVEYLVVGAHAVIFYTEPRFTKDLDVWVRPSKDNAFRVMKALSAFGAPLEHVSERDFTDKEQVYQIGIAPNRIDVLMDIGGIPFETAFEKKTGSSYDGVPIAIIGRQELIESKRRAGRPQDILDIHNLEIEH